MHVLRVLWFGIFVAAMSSPRLAWAHPTPGSIVIVEFGLDGARLEHDAPVEELERGMKAPLFERDADGTVIKADNVVAKHGDQLRGYAREHIRAAAEDGRPWGVEIRALESRESADGPRVKFLVDLTPPAGGTFGTVHLYDDLILHEVVTHYTTIYVRRDWASGITSEEPRLAGTLHASMKDIVLVREASLWRGVRSVIGLGMEHIATGTDHVLFLFMLLIATPMVAERGRWIAKRDLGATLRAILRVVTAFTIGHSVTLSLATFGIFVVPSAVVESAVALSIVATAMHALRPWFPRREAWLAGAFGLVHGLAFASTLAGGGIGRTELAWTLVGFNAGIEIAQILGLIWVAPWVLLLAATSMFAMFRSVAAIAGATLAMTWFAERAFNVPNPATAFVGVLERHPLVCLMALAGLALAARARERSKSSVEHASRETLGSAETSRITETSRIG